MKMKRFLGAVLVTVFGLSLVGPIQADEKDAKAILDKAIKALGGEEKLSKASAITWKAKGKFSFGENESGFTGQVTVQGVDHFRALFEGEFGGNPFKAVTVLSGDKGWRKFMDDSMIMDATALASEKQNLYLLITPFTLVPLKGKGFQIEVAGEEKVGDKAAVVLKVTGPDGKDFKLSFDKETGLPVKEVAKVTGFMGDEFTQERVYSVYKDFDGIKRPTKIVSKRDGEPFMDEEITEFKVLNKVDPRIFTEPK
ncbi:MAG TPA: hypothetical protein VKA15_11045 [Isosphaeraceae bacterium]|nr:hypothetical protein [Isosphaeraceae bacterium]